ncbi:predicted protein [Nematostella vectensis]|uniref:Cytochrome c oxidase assembly factor 5 n=1 Tax=Nematostella vectensis TaxID=45351 RepID=A7SLS1_NEMVE|nr:predicted protein [Nematostella vectensis]|eukprot:XP_001627461.1 predicted protein [Nematostella vectensis]
MEAIDGEEEAPDAKRAKSCAGLRSELKECILKSDCVVKHGMRPSECLKAESAGVEDDCRRVQYAFFECKRSLLDFRNRFRGRKGY